MKLLDYLFITSFGSLAMMLTNQFLDNIYITLFVGIMAIIYCFVAVKEDSKGE